jgi:hypothetical protein
MYYKKTNKKNQSLKERERERERLSLTHSQKKQNFFSVFSG